MSIIKPFDWTWDAALNPIMCNCSRGRGAGINTSTRAALLDNRITFCALQPFNWKTHRHTHTQWKTLLFPLSVYCIICAPLLLIWMIFTLSCCHFFWQKTAKKMYLQRYCRGSDVTLMQSCQNLCWMLEGY